MNSDYWSACCFLKFIVDCVALVMRLRNNTDVDKHAGYVYAMLSNRGQTGLILCNAAWATVDKQYMFMQC